MTPIRDGDGHLAIAEGYAIKRRNRKRRSAIISQLCELSRNGWANAKPFDYEPLEQELRQLQKGGAK